MPAFKRSLRTILVCSALIPVFLAGASLFTFFRYQDTLVALQRSRDRLDRTERLFSSLRDAESGQRGFLLTGRDEYLQPFLDSAGEIESQLEMLRASMDPEQRTSRDFLELQRTVRAKASELRLTVGMAQQFGADRALTVVRTGRGLEQMRTIRTISASIIQRERASYVRLQNFLRNLRLIVIGLSILGVIFSAVGSWMAYKATAKWMRERQRRESELRQMNAQLEARVVERTAELETRTAHLQRRTEELYRSNADLESFAYVASHDLQEPLRMISSFTGLLSRRYGDALVGEAREYIREVAESVTRMQGLIDDLLEYSRTGRALLRVERVPLQQVVDAAAASLGPELRQARATMVTEDLPVVQADRKQLIRVLEVLLSNAVKFRDPNTPLRITITAEALDGAGWKISVQDNGIGFDPAYREVIFRMFQRLNRTDFEGTGIGLALGKRIVEEHGGTIWADAAPGKGAKFSFTLPKNVAADSAAAPKPLQAVEGLD